MTSSRTPLEALRQMHIALNVGLRRYGYSALQACDGPDCDICKVLAALSAPPAPTPDKECTPCRNGQHCHGKGWAECRCRVCGGHPAVYAQIAPDARAVAEQIEQRFVRQIFVEKLGYNGLRDAIAAALTAATDAARREEREACWAVIEEAHRETRTVFDAVEGRTSPRDAACQAADYMRETSFAALRARSLPETPETGS